MMRVLIKVLMFPIIIMLTLVEWICNAACTLTGVACRVIAGTFILTSILSVGFGLEPWSVARRMILGGVLFLMLPLIATGILSGVMLLKTLVKII